MDYNCKFLFIYYHYPPIKNSGVYRNYFLSSAILNIIGKSFLITTDNRKYLPNEKLQLHTGIEKFEIFTLDYRRVAAWISGKKNTAGAQFSEKTKESVIVSWFIKLQRSFPFNLILAEGGIIYIMNGYLKSCKIVRSQKVDVIFSSFMPYADHIIAWMLKKTFPSLIWIADFRDLHVEPIYKNVFWPEIQHKIEKYILKNADVITTVSQGISQKMQVLHQNVHTVTKGVTLRPNKQHFDKFTIHYSGSLFQQYRDPRPLFRVLSVLIQHKAIDRQKISFLYAGKDAGLMNEWVQECGIQDIFDCKGMVSRSEAIEMQDRAHVNLLLTSSSEEHTGLLTGKLFEYIESGNEVLCLINGPHDKEIEAMFTKYRLGEVHYHEEHLYKYIEDLYFEFINCGLVKSKQLKDEIMDDMSWERQAKRVLDLVKTVKERI
jgi:hypothetical protein